ncbi:uncharacterized protein LOC117173673 [Belonocnema kinseyi]|uniref:uncharacterized protein LOC117173673 n=1 Tax=Belonocnema kinseyi TaxID=2817044 RepID=UPI00143D2062|nr:uncharacterized protein LOC117173673 [Belonocnema kinseyi]
MFNYNGKERVQEINQDNEYNFAAGTSYHYGTSGRYDTPEINKFMKNFNEDKTIFPYILRNDRCKRISKMAIKMFAQIESEIEKNVAANIRVEFLLSNFYEKVERGLMYDEYINVIASQFYNADEILPYLIFQKILFLLPAYDMKNICKTNC